MGVLRFFNLFCGPIFYAVGMKQAIIGVFMVGHDDAMGRAAIERKKHQAVVVHAHLRGLLCGGVGSISAVGRHIAGDADRLAPSRHDIEAIAGWHLYKVFQAGRQCLKIQTAAGRSAGVLRIASAHVRQQ